MGALTHPEKFIRKQILIVKNKSQVVVPNQVTFQNHSPLISCNNIRLPIPYISGLFEKLKPAFKQINIDIVGQAFNTLKQILFSNLKDKIPELQQSNVIYKIKCECNQVYVGQTIRKLEKRLYDHKYHLRNQNGAHSALCQHAAQMNHTPNWEEVEIVTKHSKKRVLDVLEMIEIRKAKNTLNIQEDSMFLPAVYNNLLNIEK